ncbi:PAAR domain-containing protein [Undibacterium umbellatum]|uniref:PAAR domain-containing protein n=1 Tax=Undibacterium umbellatum TaxID=2762300 RepID=A0ABR6ZIW1_9BURK|nr:PAAR domain-containing protein [Undibacterium umbellatum]MBC3911546.1 PAAR domain-containing protein [Undibacterium umbellatum]
MSHGIAVKTLDRAGGPHRAGGQDFFAVDGALVVVLGDSITPHGPVPHASPVMAQGSAWMTLNGIPACRAGHLASCGHASTGRSWFVIPE